jgi:CubicO group peptidase (beta-lactamase class C family)
MKFLFIFLLFLSLYIGCKKNLEAVNQDLTAHYFDTDLLNEALEDANNISDLYSLLIGRNGDLIIENYYNGQGPDSLHDVRSVTKSITSILVGIAIDKGYISNTNQLMYTFFGSLVDSIGRDKLKISIDHLLTMSGGFEWVPFGDWSEYNNWRNATDQINYILNKPIISAPGEVFNYNDAASHLLSVIVQEAVGIDLLEFAQQYLFNPLDIPPRPWITDNRGYPLGCVALFLTSKDMYKIGKMFLQNGIFNGNRIVSEKWIQKSTQVQISTGGVIPFGVNYGYLWWIDYTNGIKFYMAMGYGGQFIVLAPEKNLIVVATCDWHLNENLTGQNWYNTISLIVNKIIPAAK